MLQTQKGCFGRRPTSTKIRVRDTVRIMLKKSDMINTYPLDKHKHSQNHPTELNKCLDSVDIPQTSQFLLHF